MGNGSSGSSGVRRYDEESSLMDLAQDLPFEGHQATLANNPLHHMPMNNPLVFTSQARNEHMQTWKHNLIGEEDYTHTKLIPTMIVWSRGGMTVAVEGSWDNWKKKELLEKVSDDFVTVKLLRSGVYHYRFLVNGRWAHDEQLPWAEDDLGRVCNILDVQEYVPEATESRSALEAPPSPDSSYDNTLDSTFYAKDPPMLPPILHTTILNISQPARHTSLPRPPHAILDHLYIREIGETPPVLAIGSTQRFREKYVTVELYEPLRKSYQ